MEFVRKDSKLVAELNDISFDSSLLKGIMRRCNSLV
jgi:hypothetical protein